MPHLTLPRLLQQLPLGATWSTLSDAELLHRFRTTADEEAFAALVRRHGPMVLAACRRVLANAGDVEDTFQATFLVLVRKHTTIRHEPCLGSWLFGVARRLALQTQAANQRRQRHEAAVPVPPRSQPADLSWQEANALLHQELAALPDRYRRVLWLCYFEQRPRDEVAELLGWSVGAVKGCLERGRQLLRRRLEKRGLTLPAGLLFTALANEARAVPATLVQRTLQTPSSTVQALAHSATHSTRSLWWGVLLVGTLLGVFTALGAGSAEPPEPKEPKTPPKGPPSVALPVAKKEPVTVTGTVTQPDGRPAKATVYLVADSRKSLAHVATAADGTFRLTFAPDEIPTTNDSADAWLDAELVAVAEGFGPEWTRLRELLPNRWQAKLVPDEPIVGTLRNLEGQPVAGVTVTVADVRAWSDSKMLTEHLEYVQSGRTHPSRYRWGAFPQQANMQTDAKGQFRLAGCGAERMVTLRVGGPGIAWNTVTVCTRAGKPINGKRDNSPFVVLPSTFDWPLAPGRTVKGTIRDRVALRAVPGVRVSVGPHVPEAITDAAGNYTLHGVPMTEKGMLSLRPGPTATAYLGRRAPVRWEQAGLADITTDVNLERGLPVRVQLRVRGSSKPVHGTVSYLALHPTSIPMSLDSTQMMLHRQADGSYAGACLPGPGAIVVRAEQPSQFVPAMANQKEFFKLDVMPSSTYGGPENALWLAAHGNLAPRPLIASQFQAVQFINPTKVTKEVNVTLELDPGASKTLRFVDGAGQPVTGAHIKDGFGGQFGLLRTSECVLGGVGETTQRVLMLRHDAKQLAARVAVDAKTTTPQNVVLQPWGTVTGRLLNAAGQPLVGYSLYGLPDVVVTDRNGRFHIEKLPPDDAFQVYVGTASAEEPWPTTVQVKPGATLDLGDVQMPAKKD